MQKRIGIISYPGKSGLTHYSYSLCRELSRVCPDVYFITNRYAEFNDADLSCNVVRIFSRVRWLGIKYLQLVFFVFLRNIQIVHMQSWMINPSIEYYLIKLFKVFGKKIVFTVHDVLPASCDLLQLYFCKKMYCLADAIICHSKNNRSRIEELIGKPRNDIFVIPHGIYDMFLPGEHIAKVEAKKTLSLDPSSKIMLLFGGLNKRKGIPKFIAQMKKIVQLEPAIKLLIAGKSDYPEGMLINLAKRHGVKENVEIVEKWVDRCEVPLYFSAADVIVMPYLEGYTSGVLKLAYAFKKPVIVTEMGELADLVREDKTGIVISDELSTSDVNNIIALLNDCETKYNEEVFNNLLIKYSWGSIAFKTRDVYKTLFK